MPLLRSSVFLLLILAITGCSTKAFFKLPEHSTITINERAEQHPQGLVKIRPFFWNRAGGVPYKLTSATGQTISEGKLRTRFRVVSIFWPPYSIIYWPMGFGQRCYDMTGAMPGSCTHQDLWTLREEYRNNK
ncbi:hypothetical protein [Phytopseudomonas punonensis]|uniref:Uncharacterized protein n=1 Tax=Phytopseudomonas punonensis TaxID=1220495 RepID=A0A1M7AF36_9GAMM|nr:hypothetical protein [Pseudomonas punonensis]SHL41352.1 hypothetical protein SAMN05216288_1872 [Pseudomonas punonensis]